MVPDSKASSAAACIDDAIDSSTELIALYSQNLIGFALIDGSGEILRANEGFYGHVGISKTDNPIKVESRRLINRIISSLNATSSFASIESPIKDQTVRFLVRKFKDESRDVMSVISLDETAIKDAHREVELYKDIFYAAKIGLCIDIESGSSLGLMNAAFAETHGYTVEELVGKPVADIFPEDLRSQLPELEAWVDKEGHGSFLSEHVKKDGTRFPVLVDVTVVKDAQEKFLYRIVNVRDISDIKAAEEKLKNLNEHLEQLVIERTEELERSQDRLRQAERLASLGSLAAGISHELNNPLNAIVMGLEQMGRKLKKGEDADETLKMLKQYALRCGAITTDILSFARKKGSQKSVLSLSEPIAEGVRLAKQFSRTPLEVRLNLPEKSSSVLANRLEIEQLIVNLLQNAANASQQGVEVMITGEEKDNNYILTISDNGPGMAPDVLNRIFDPFFTTRADRGGTGLGLSFVYGVIKDHGGEITVSSKLGQGTAFTITLPITTADAATNELQQEAVPTA